MSRLVDIDDVIPVISNHHFDENKNDFDLLIHNLCKEVKKMPTAYDVEKVVHELRKATKCNIDCYEGRASEVADYDDSWNDDIISACEAIEIVRKGGVE